MGRSIIRWLEAWAAQNGKAALTCRVRMEMEANMRLYRSEGFVVTQEEIVQREGTTGIPTAHMRKTILLRICEKPSVTSKKKGHSRRGNAQLFGGD
ncbi:GNAT family N-acetyltransferase [Brevibacillus agri]|uniref:GNAT family N-acetyltransferase n=1 Tax=Brevibacillus agri TaxID=51101 RepID=UPI003D2246FF